MKRLLLFVLVGIVAFLIVVAASVWFGISTVGQLKRDTAFLNGPPVGAITSEQTGLTPRAVVAAPHAAGSSMLRRSVQR